MRETVGQPEPSIDLDLICWFCDAPFGRDELADDAYLIPRHDKDGGPYRVYRCRKCDKVYEVEDCPGDMRRLAPRGFRVESHDLTLYGLCADCR